MTYSPDDPTRTQWQPTLEPALQPTPPISGSAPSSRSRKSLFWPGFALGFLLLGSIACGGLAATLGLTRISLDDIRNSGAAVWTPPPVTAAPPTTAAQIAAPATGVSDRFPAGATVRNITASRVNIRATPGYLGKAASDIIGQIAPGAQMTTLGESQTADNLTWWRIRYQDAGAVIDGWVAEATASGVQILGQ